MLLKGKNILVGLTGSIAVYKALELTRLYIKAGASVKVVMTQGAQKFINPITFEAISQNKVLCEDSENWSKDQDYNHIDIGKWADIFVLAPCSANSINKLACGIADNILSQSILAFTKKIILAPAANTNMLHNPITQDSLKKLEKNNFKIVKTISKELVCKDFGNGAMAEVEEIFHISTRELLKEDYWLDRKVVLSGGGTIEKIDDVRYLSNFSSGKMANALCLALYYKGANVTLVSTRGYENLAKNIKIIPVQSSQDMLKELNTTIRENKNDTKKPYFFMVAAVSDYIPIYKKGKIKKDDMGDSWNLKLEKNIDILNSLDKKSFISIGFKAECDEKLALDNAKSMLEKKNLDAVCLNMINKENNPFGSNSNKYEIIFKEGSHKVQGEKTNISFDILNTLQKEFR